MKNGAISGPILETFLISKLIKSYKNNGLVKPPLYFYIEKEQNEIDVVIEDSGVLYPIEIKKTANPQKSMVKNFTILNKASGYTVGNKVFLCQVDKKDVLRYRPRCLTYITNIE